MRSPRPAEILRVPSLPGTLSIGTKGDSCFYGATARGEVSATFLYQRRVADSVGFSFLFTCRAQFLFQAQAPRRHPRPSYFQHTRLSERILSVPFPEASPEQIAPEIRRMVYNHLPAFEDARGTCELFLNYSSYMCVFPVVSSSLSDERARSFSLTREELLHVLETVYHHRCAQMVNGLTRASLV